MNTNNNLTTKEMIDRCDNAQNVIDTADYGNGLGQYKIRIAIAERNFYAQTLEGRRLDQPHKRF